MNALEAREQLRKGWKICREGEMVRARLSAETLPTSAQLARRRRLAAAVILGLVLGAGGQLAWPGFVPGFAWLAAEVAMGLVHWLVLVVLVSAVWTAVLFASWWLAILTTARHG